MHWLGENSIKVVYVCVFVEIQRKKKLPEGGESEQIKVKKEEEE
jgi:hypothetical protein